MSFEVSYSFISTFNTLEGFTWKWQASRRMVFSFLITPFYKKHTK